MATKPTAYNDIPIVKTLADNNGAVLQAMLNSGSERLQNVGVVTDDLSSVKGIGTKILGDVALTNEFVNLLNRIALVLVTSKFYENPWAVMKKGVIDLGESVEEAFVNLAKPHEYNPERAEKEVFKREIPDIMRRMHVMNYTKFYKQTVSYDMLTKAFLSFNGVNDLIAKIVQAMFSAAAYDEFLTMKYLIALSIIRGELYTETIAAPTAETMKEGVVTIKSVVNSMQFMSSKYTAAGNMTYSDPNDIYIIINAKYDAQMDVEVLASAFNMDKADFIGRRVLVDSFGALDTARLDELFAEDDTYVKLTPEQLQALDAIPAIVMDRDWFMIFDNLNRTTDIFNSDGLYINYDFHVWRTMSSSPFQNACAFVTGAPAVTAVAVTPTEVTMQAGKQVQLAADVTTEDFAPTGVKWTSDNQLVSVSDTGMVKALKGATGTATITATSLFDSTKSATATITIS